MDAGCYAINWLRMLGPGEPEVVSARAKLHSPDVDRAMSASFRFAGGVLGRMTASLWSGQLLRLDAKAVGDRGVMRVFNYVSPQRYNRLTVTADGYTRRERVSGEPSYTHQLRAFAAAVLHGDPVLTTPEDAVANMTVIDAVYQAAGLPPRGGLSPAGRRRPLALCRSARYRSLCEHIRPWRHRGGRREDARDGSRQRPVSPGGAPPGLPARRAGRTSSSPWTAGWPSSAASPPSGRR